MTATFLRSVLRPEHVRLCLQASLKDDAIRELIGILDEAGLLKNRDEAERVVFDREQAMSTGMENGIAIPHGKTDTVDNLLVGLALKPDGIDFCSFDKQPSTILIIVISPLRNTGPHLRFMAEISKILRNPDTRRLILEARTPEQVVNAIIGAAK
jgi:mannitol/fructose-specific phosphotransferase system IIA component (Ntr-type)